MGIAPLDQEQADWFRWAEQDMAEMDAWLRRIATEPTWPEIDTEEHPHEQ